MIYNSWLFDFLFILAIALSIWLTIGVKKRIKGVGCISFGLLFFIIVGALQLCVGSWAMLVSTTADARNAFFNGQEYTAYVVATDTYVPSEGELTNTETMYAPIVVFVLPSGDSVQKTLDFSTTDVHIGDTHEVLYNPESGELVALDYTALVAIVASLIFTIFMSLVAIVIFLFGTNRSLKGFKNVIKKTVICFIIPCLMIGFEALLIWLLFYHSGEWSSELFAVGGFALALGLFIYFYFKVLIQNGVPNMRQVGLGKWVGDWEAKTTPEPTTDTSKPKDKSDNDNPFLIK